MYKEATRYHVVAESQSADVIVNKTIPRRWPSIETPRINVTCLLVYRTYIQQLSVIARIVTTRIGYNTMQPWIPKFYTFFFTIFLD